MPINVKISLCKITRASKLFQRNYYLPLLKPLSPKDALRRKIITGQNILGSRIEHYIPALESYEERMIRRKRRPKGIPIIKKRVRMLSRLRYVTPFFDDDMENHKLLKRVISKEPKGKGQSYVYEVFDKGCALVIPFQMEKAIKDKEIVDVVMAQRSEKVVVKLSDGTRVSMPLAKYEGGGPLYRGSGWTREVIEEEHHHGKETYSLAKLFEAKEQGVEEWELEMMRLANKRKKKLKGEESSDWKQMLAGCLENMDWDKFEEDTRQIVDEKDELVDKEDIPMSVDDMEKTKNVNEKLRQGGEEVLAQLPTMKEVPEVIKILDEGELCELQDVSGMRVMLTDGKQCFVAGQMVKGDENEVFVPGQTLVNDEGNFEYTPGITVCMDNEPMLIPGLVMGEDNSGAMFLPGDSTITEEGQLQFEATEEDLPPKEKSPISSESESESLSELSPSPSPEPSPSPSESSSSPSPVPSPPRKRSLSPSPPPRPQPKPRPKKPEEPIVIKRRVIKEPEDVQPLIKEKKVKKRLPTVEIKKEEKPRIKINLREPLPPREDPLKLLMERRMQEEAEDKKRLKERSKQRIMNEANKVDNLRLQIRQKYIRMRFDKPAPYKAVEPVKKSTHLQELEQSIRKGTFFENETTKNIMSKIRGTTRLARMTNSLKHFVGMGFGKYNSLDYGSLYLGISRSLRIPLF